MVSVPWCYDREQLSNIARFESKQTKLASRKRKIREKNYQRRHPTSIVVDNSARNDRRTSDIARKIHRLMKNRREDYNEKEKRKKYESRDSTTGCGRILCPRAF